MDNILITGGTGTLGQAIIKQVADIGVINVISTKEKADMSRPVNVFNADLTDIESLRTVAEAADIIIHCASNPTNAKVVDLEGTCNLLACVNKTRLKHFIYISIAGIDKSTFPYYIIKQQVEQLIMLAGVPFSILRPTQFHEFVLYRMIKPFEHGTNLTIPAGLKFQSVDVADVAGKIKDLIQTGPANDVTTIGGPEILTIEEMAKTYLTTLGLPASITPEKMEGERFDMLRSGINLCKDKAFGKITWQQYLNNLANHDKL
jgi:uncharacterized protein YbjT (DUF2867 family)